METYTKTIEFSTDKEKEIIDMTGKVTKAVAESGIKNGILVTQLPHATAMLVLNENESGLRQDYLEKLEDLAPSEAEYKHDRIDNNAHSHVKAAFTGSPRVLPIIDGTLVKGTWQSFLVIEQDGPRSRRRFVIFIMGE